MPDSLTPNGRNLVNAILLAERSPAAGRVASLPGFLARRLLSVKWMNGLPPEGSRAWAAEVLRAELDWSHADWRRLNGCVDIEMDRGPAQISEAVRLPHERFAATALNALQHAGADAHYARQLRRTMRAQREAGWAAKADATRDERAGLVERRRKAVQVYVRALAGYRATRALIDRPDLAMAVERASRNTGPVTTQNPGHVATVAEPDRPALALAAE